MMTPKGLKKKQDIDFYIVKLRTLNQEPAVTWQPHQTDLKGLDRDDKDELSASQ